MFRSLLILTAVMIPAFSEAAVCLRFPGTDLRQMPAGDCQESLLQFERDGRRGQLMDDYESFLNEQERSPKKAWRSFIQKALKKTWSAEDQMMVTDVIDWAGRQKWKMDTKLSEQMKRLQSPEELNFAPTPGRKSIVEQIALIPGFEDVQVLTPMIAGEDEGNVLLNRGARRWIVMSSVYQAQAFWAEARELPGLVKAGGAIPWVQGQCREPQFAKVKTTRYEMRAYDKNGCATANLARISETSKAQSFNPGPSGANTASLPEFQKSRSNHWLWVTLLAGAAAAYGLRDKTVVITHGFGR